MATIFQDFVNARLVSLRWSGRALRHRNYRLFFMGQGISLVGTWMQRMALQWFVYHWTGSTWIMGSLDAIGQVPAFLMAPWAGLVADRFSRHRMVVITQCAAMVQAALLGILVLTHTVQVWHLFALSILLGLINGFDMPLRQAFVVEMVDDKADLGNAIVLNSGVFNGARLIGPSVGGFVVAVVGAGLCFVLNAVSYIAVIWALLLMKVKPRERLGHVGGGLQSLVEGFTYVWQTKPIRYLLLNLSFVGIAGTSYLTLMPVFAKDVLKGGPQTLGLLTASVGVGALFGAAFLASRKQELGLGKLIWGAMVLYATTLLAFSWSTMLPLSMAIVAGTGLGTIMTMAGTNTMIQTLVEEDKRGRVMSIYAMATMGAAPIGSLWSGAVANYIGAPLTVWIGGILLLLASVVFIYRMRETRHEVRRLYDERNRG